MALVKAFNLEPMNISRLRPEVRFDIGATCILDGPEQTAQTFEFRTTRDGNAYSRKEFVEFFPERPSGQGSLLVAPRGFGG